MNDGEILIRLRHNGTDLYYGPTLEPIEKQKLFVYKWFLCNPDFVFAFDWMRHQVRYLKTIIRKFAT